MEEFFKQIGQRVILSPEDTVAMGAMRTRALVVFWKFSASLLSLLVNERKVQLKKLANEELTYLKIKTGGGQTVATVLFPSKDRKWYNEQDWSGTNDTSGSTSWRQWSSPGKHVTGFSERFAKEPILLN